VKAKTIILVAMLVFLVYGSGIIYAYHVPAYPGYDSRYDILIGGIQIEITGAVFGGPPDLYPYNICSLSFPVKIKGYNPPLDRGFITAGHCVRTGDYIDQPKKLSWFDWSNFIGRVRRNSFPHGGGTTNVDTALIYLAHCPGNYPCIPTRDFKPFIFENNSTPYFGTPDYNREVGITAYITPTKDMEDKVIVHKSGRSTGVTYGIIRQIDAEWRLSDADGNPVTLKPAIYVTRCDKRGACFYDRDITLPHDSGSVVYIRHLIHSERIGNVHIYHYGAQVIGILVGGPIFGVPTRYFYAIWAVLVKERWPDLELVTCGPDIGRCL
jgi:hypothetical protein